MITTISATIHFEHEKVGPFTHKTLFFFTILEKNLAIVPTHIFVRGVSCKVSQIEYSPIYDEYGIKAHGISSEKIKDVLLIKNPDEDINLWSIDEEDAEDENYL